VIGVGAPGMPPAAAREPTAVVLQRKTSSLRTGAAAAAAAASHDNSSAAVTEAAPSGLSHHDIPVRRRPRAGDVAAAAALRASSDLALSHFSAESADSASVRDGYDMGSVHSAEAGPQAFQLKWPLQPQPVNSAHSHLSNAAAKISAAADRYGSAAGTSKAPNLQSPTAAGIPTDGLRSSLSRRSAQSSGQSSTHSLELKASMQSDPFASRPLLGNDMMLSPTSRV